MTGLGAAYRILAEVGKPLHYKELARRMLDQRLWQTGGATPWATVNAQLGQDIKKKGSASRFTRLGKGIFGLREWGSASLPPTPKKQKPVPDTMSFTDAVEHVLEHSGDKMPMNYRDITDIIIKEGLVHTAGKSPWATVNAQVHSEIKRKRKRGDIPRFVMHGRGMVGLMKWLGRGLEAEIKKQNESVKRKLHAQLHSMDPFDFEELVKRLLDDMGFEDTEVTARTGDGGIDVRGTLVVGDVIRTRMAIQVKRWRQNVRAPVVQQVRGSLGTHDQGLIITTSDFAKGARDEARRSDAIPVGLMNGVQLVDLLVEHSIGVTRTQQELLELGESETG